MISNETNSAGVTFRVTLALIPLAASVAVMVVLPSPTLFAKPIPAVSLPMVATAASLEFQVTDAVISWVVESEKVPVAVNCSVVPKASDGSVGVISMETKLASVTLSVVLPLSPLAESVAVIATLPAATALARPLLAASLPTVAIVSSADVQSTCAVMSWVVKSEKIPVAVNCVVMLIAAVGSVGVMLNSVNTAEVTVSVVSALILVAESIAEIVTVPISSAVAAPRALLSLKSTTLGLLEPQLTDEVMFRVLESS